VAPIAIVLLLGALIVLTQDSALALLIYTLFCEPQGRMPIFRLKTTPGSYCDE
jgi:hypothetical protein